MELIGRDALQSFAHRHPDARVPLCTWAQAVETNRFRHFLDLRKTFGSADPVSPHTVFNIAGNKYRLIALVNYRLQAVIVEQVLTHAEYDLGRWRRHDH